MKKELFKNKQVKIFLIESSSTIRSALSDVLRKKGFQNITSFGALKEALDVLEVEKADWIITSLQKDEKVNAIQILKIITESVEIRNCRLSLLIREGEEDFLPLAYENGLLSHHNLNLPGKYSDEFSEFLRRTEEMNYKSTLISAAYLREYLRRKEHYQALEQLERSLLQLYPGNSGVLLNLAETKLLAGDFDGARTILAQVGLLGEKLATRAHELYSSYCDHHGDESELDFSFDEENSDISSDNKLVNTLGIETVLIIDPDTAVQHSLKRHLEAAGVKNIVVFEDGDSAWRWIKNGGKPDLVTMEWRIPGISGPYFLQRIRHQYLTATPVVLTSSLIKPEDTVLLNEMRVSAVLEKPFDHQTFFSEVIWTLQQEQLPTEQLTLELKISQSLEIGNLEAANRLKGLFLANEDFSEASKFKICSLFEFHQGNYENAAKFAVKSLKLKKNDLELLNLLGKAFLKLGQHKKALQCLERAKTISPKNLERICNIATTYAELGNTDKADEELETAKKLDPGASITNTTDAKIGMLNGDEKRTRSAMEKLDSLKKLLAYMNNKAVALTRCDRFEEGINLYKCARNSIPGEWGHTHEIISYNLGLAHIRYFDQDTALEELQKIRPNQTTSLAKKATSLIIRIQQCQKKGENLILEHKNPAPRTPEIPKNEFYKPMEKEKNLELEKDFLIESEEILAGLDVVKGEICCFQLFFGNGLINKESLDLIKNRPNFRKRKAIKREQTMSFNSGAA